MVRYVVKCATLLIVSVFALYCPWCTVEACGKCTSGMISLSWRGVVVEVGCVDWWGRCKVVVSEHSGKHFSFSLGMRTLCDVGCEENVYFVVG